MGTQNNRLNETENNRLNETVLLSTQNTCLYYWVRKLLNFYANKISLSGPSEEGSVRLRIGTSLVQQSLQALCCVL